MSDIENDNYDGVTLVSLHKALGYIIFNQYSFIQALGEEKGIAAWQERVDKYIIPMQHNYFSPLVPDANDTFVEFLIERDERITNDHNERDYNGTLKVAHIFLRFLGKKSEDWAKIFHHLTGMKDTGNIFYTYCNANLMPKVSDITHQSIDYFGRNAAISSDLRFNLRYVEMIDTDYSELDSVSLGKGSIEV